MHIKHFLPSVASLHLLFALAPECCPSALFETEPDKPRKRPKVKNVTIPFPSLKGRVWERAPNLCASAVSCDNHMQTTWHESDWLEDLGRVWGRD